MNKASLGIKIRENKETKPLIDNIRAYCKVNNITISDFAKSVFEAFFKDKKNLYAMMSKEQLIEELLKGGTKNE